MSNLPANQPPSRRSRRELTEYSRNPNTLRMLMDRAVVSWKLLWDNRVGFLPKMIPLAAIAYVISPFDFLPEMLMGPLGVFDDVGIIMLGLTLFIQAAPPDIVREHLRALSAGRGELGPGDDTAGYSEDDVVDGEIVE